MMQEEMRGQMVFQNKMRALKQIELSKYGGGGDGGVPDPLSSEISPRRSTDDADGGAPGGGTAAGRDRPRPREGQAQGGADASPGRTQFSETLDQDMIWNPEDDDQIFDFLMEH